MSLHLLWDYERLAVFAFRKFVCLFVKISDESLVISIHFKPRPENPRCRFNIHSNDQQVLLKTLVRNRNYLISLDDIQPIGDVAHVTESAGKVSFGDVGI